MAEQWLALFGAWQAWLWTGAGLLVGAAVGVLAWWLGLWMLGRITRSTRAAQDDLWVKALRAPAALILPAYGAQLALGAVPVPAVFEPFLHHTLSLVMIAGVGWLAVSLVHIGSRLLAQRYGRKSRSAFSRRALETRIHLLERVVTTVVVVLIAAVMLMTVPAGRQIGASILASAGIAGIVAGLAARSMLANLLAGMQLALTEPVRIGDVVVIEGEYGTVEQITTAFVVVQTWDLRRLMVPLSYFMEHRFENWTWQSSELLGVAILYVDYQTPVELLRAELQRILEHAADWDKRVGLLQVTDTTEHAVQVRALVSASESGKLWNLRCEVREKLLAFLQREYPQCLPKVRAELALTDGAGWVSKIASSRLTEAPARDR